MLNVRNTFYTTSVRSEKLYAIALPYAHGSMLVTVFIFVWNLIVNCGIVQILDIVL